MAITQMSDDVDVISKLSDTPNDSLTAAQLKGKFDSAAVLLKNYINGTLVPTINTLLGYVSGGYINIAKIQDGSITTAKLAAACVTAAKIAAGAVESAALNAGAVITEKIANSAVTKDKVNFLVTTLNEMSDDVVPTSKAIATYVAQKILAGVADGSITTVKLANGAVTTAKLANYGVTVDKLGTGAVTAEKVSPGAITTEKMSAAAVTMEKTNFVEDSLSDGLNSKVPTSKAVADYVKGRVPAPPASDGTYALKVTVSDGEATYSWV